MEWRSNQRHHHHCRVRPGSSQRQLQKALKRGDSVDCCHSPILLCLVTASPHSALEIKGHLQSVL
jgi:hypothetical protein